MPAEAPAVLALFSLHMGCLSAAAAREERSLEECVRLCCKEIYVMFVADRKIRVC